MTLPTPRVWSSSTPGAAGALAAAAETHYVNPLPAYDQDAVLLEPQYYAKRSDGATVIIRFELLDSQGSTRSNC
ncbi:hypothetical protein BDM02DRAFT_3119669 [Thelephora ganbajun]|uniref:Uncharacterized protein n=1 Tax=Thelephora ganbajun TaxID=370292 RepID=A0ACB6Z8I0_THEGA|nr:hypothetical protein BDM02DRAFT_3119669 [Thelephora ganbajun]